MLDCRFSFGAYAENLREKATKCLLKTTEILLNAMYIPKYLPKFDIYQGSSKFF